MDFSSIEVFRYFLTNMEDQPWKDVRSAITPTFTTGKIKRVRWISPLTITLAKVNNLCCSFLFVWLQYAVQMKEVTEKYYEHFRSIAENQGKMELKK